MSEQLRPTEQLRERTKHWPHTQSDTLSVIVRAILELADQREGEAAGEAGSLERESADLVCYGLVDVDRHEFVFPRDAQRLADEGHRIIDLATITKDQLVQPGKKDDWADMLRGRIVIKQIAKGGYEVTWAGNDQPGERHVIVDLDVVRHLCPQAISQSEGIT